jgi:hypothetical protein
MVSLETKYRGLSEGRSALSVDSVGATGVTASVALDGREKPHSSSLFFYSVGENDTRKETKSNPKSITSSGHQRSSQNSVSFKELIESFSFSSSDPNKSKPQFASAVAENGNENGDGMLCGVWLWFFERSCFF